MRIPARPDSHRRCRRSRRRCHGWRSKYALGARQHVAFTTQGVAQRTAHALEAAFDHVMCILASDLDVYCGAERLAERTEEVRNELGGQTPDLLARETAFEHRPRTSGQIDGDLRL